MVAVAENIRRNSQLIADDAFDRRGIAIDSGVDGFDVNAAVQEGM